MNGARQRFTLLQRLLHWLMAVCVLAMLFIGVGMVSTIMPKYLTLVSIHKQLGISILVLAHRQAAANHAELRLVVLSAAVLRALKLVRMDFLLPIYSNLDAALTPAAAPESELVTPVLTGRGDSHS